MQLPPIILVGVLAAATAGLQVNLLPATAPPWAGMAILLGGLVLVVASAAVLVPLSLRSANRRLALIRASRSAAGARAAVLLLHVVAVLGLGWLDAVRSELGDVILLDEIVAVTPALLAIVATWWIQYPIERRVRDALMLRHLDRGGPLYPLLSRGDYVALHLRCGMLLLLVPILLILGLAETIDAVAGGFVATDADAGAAIGWPLDLAKFASALSVLAISPLLARAVLTVRPIPQGETRSLLSDVCTRHRVKVRDILLWNTGGTMINAAVMGLLRPLRYVLMTDALVESMDREEIQAVMAHEVGHVRRHHMPWLVAALITAVLGLTALTNLAIVGLVRTSVIDVDGTIPPVVDIGLLVIQAAGALALFGWISRRFERQADVFAVQHLSGSGVAAATAVPDSAEVPDTPGAGPRTAVVTGEAVGAMQSALGRIAELNTVSPERRSWRHGSIAWRQRYLGTLVGKPLESLAIDRLVRRIKRLTLVSLGAVIALEAAAFWLLQPEPADRDAASENVVRCLPAAKSEAPAT